MDEAIPTIKGGSRMRTKYEIGQEIYWASFSAHAHEYVTCPDCGGTGRLRVIFHDETTVSIPCANCAKGYEEPSGLIHVYCRKGVAESGRISGLEINGDNVEYRISKLFLGTDGHTFSGGYIVKECDAFLTEQEAKEKADIMAAEYDAEERARIFKKEKDTRTWAWNASYHRREMKDAERKLEYHSKKLSHAALKAKDEKKVNHDNNQTASCGD